MKAVAKLAAADFRSLELRVEVYDWDPVSLELNAFGSVVLEKLLTANECDCVASLYANDEHFRSRVDMARHGFGRGEYKYFKYPLPIVIAELRSALYPHIVTFANAWNERMNIGARYPQVHADYLKLCHDAGQVRPTPLLLQYATGDFNCLHHDLYGDLVFPFQVTILLSEPNRDFTGGDFILTEQRPRMQTRAVHNRPVQGTRGNYRVNLRHGVSRIGSGYRRTVGIIFHDAR